MPAAPEGRLAHLHVVPAKRGAPVALESARVRPGRGLPGDHHDRPGIRRAVTAIRSETLADVAHDLRIEIAPGASRRNLTITGLDLDALEPGTRLVIGDATFEITGPCDPCERMERAIGPGALARMKGRGGVVMKVVVEGELRPGDTVRVLASDAKKPKPRPRKAIATPGPAIDPVGGGARVGQLQRALLDWFRATKRDLPWRRTKDPYAVWVSEVMLQQTQVATVIPYWERFLAKFPTVRALAAAPLDDVLPLWSGLGYYARCRNMHKCAQAVVERHGGAFPADLEALAALPGFGPYTAGAVGSIALGLDAPLVDGNVARVLCRLEGWTLGSEAARDQSWGLAPKLVPRGEAGDWNQALMELGATVCTPATPRCGGCPARSLCEAAVRGEPATYPLPKERKARKRLGLAALVLRDGAEVLLWRRPDGGLFGGLWELPSVEVPLGVDARGPALDLAARWFDAAPTIAPLGRVTAVLTHRDVEVELFGVDGIRPQPPEHARWVTPADLPSLGLSTLSARLLVAARVPVPEGHARRRAVKPGQGKLF